MLAPAQARADYEIQTDAALLLGTGSNDFAPFYVYSNRHGKLSQSSNALIDLSARDTLNIDRRFDYAWGVEALAGWTSSADYMQFDRSLGHEASFSRHPARIWLQQLYAEVKWRCLMLSVGMRDRNSVFVDQNLSSGDVVWSGNSRAIPEVRIGFVGFQDIPWINHWVQADICLSYGKFADTRWIEHHFSYDKYQGINPGGFWTYKRIYLRSNPDKPFMFQLGFQMTGLFGGHSMWYNNQGECYRTTDNYDGFKDFFEMLLPYDRGGKEGYVKGDHKGSWDLAARYRFRGGETLRAYTQWFWEDGTGILKKNGWDGLWGIEFKSGRRWWINGAVLEYLDFTHQSGKLHWDPSQTPDVDLNYQVRGHDNYYNNNFYRSYVNYGMTIGTPMMPGTIFNLNGCPNIRRNVVRGVHVGIEGSLGSDVDYRVKYGWRRAWGQVNTSELLYPVDVNSWSVEAGWNMSQVPGLTLKAQIAMDHGRLPQNAFGVMIGASWSGNLLFRSHKRALLTASSSTNSLWPFN